jgi:CheY-like chemotaxis protein
MIRSLGFSVSAVWNGREVLEYMQRAQDGKERKPDIILMDVQMPMIDGYKCTHLLRHHCPYKAFVDDVPIVAMTASAIQGDRERCTRAGMDDYLSKPVKKVMLERMLVRWTLTGRTGHTTTPVGSEACSEAGDHCTSSSIPEASEQPTPIVAIDANPMEFSRPAWRALSGGPGPTSAARMHTAASAREAAYSSHQAQLASTLRRTSDAMRGVQPDGGGAVDVVAAGPSKALTEENIGQMELERTLREGR